MRSERRFGDGEGVEFLGVEDEGLRDAAEVGGTARARLASSLALPRAGRRMDMSVAMMAVTTRSSMRVKADRAEAGDLNVDVMRMPHAVGMRRLYGISFGKWMWMGLKPILMCKEEKNQERTKVKPPELVARGVGGGMRVTAMVPVEARFA